MNTLPDTSQTVINPVITKELQLKVQTATLIGASMADSENHKKAPFLESTEKLLMSY
jgi:hypothetical protein